MNDDNDNSRRMVEHCYRTTQTMVNPIVDWTDDVWDFLNHYGCKSNPLYQCGFKRIGCIGCPMAAKHRYAEFARYPIYQQNYIKAFDRMLKRREELGKNANLSWRNGTDVFRWWMGEDFTQMRFEDLEE
jgi:phosphoadenosine phosphosulfate reductase